MNKPVRPEFRGRVEVIKQCSQTGENPIRYIYPMMSELEKHNWIRARIGKPPLPQGESNE